jgi:hypothetical protein
MSWAYKGTLTVDHNQCGGSNSSAFPVCVQITDASLKTTAHSGQINNTVTQSGGNAVTMPADLIFTSDSGGTTKIPWEFESYDGVNGIIIAWVQVATLSNSANTVFYAFYGDATVTTQQNTGSYAPSAVWDTNYKCVWHLPNGTTLSGTDSTGANSLTNNGASAGSGQIDGAAVFTSGHDMHVTSPSSALQTTSDITVSAWVKLPTLSGDQAILINWDGPTQRKFLFDASGANILWAIQGAGLGLVTSAASLSTNTWANVVGTYASATGAQKIYVNGVLDANSTINADGSLVTSSDPVYIGDTQGNARPFVGTIDEARISSIVRSADWILAGYNNQKASSTFLSASLTALSSGTTVTPGYVALALTKYAPKLQFSFKVPLATMATSGKVPSLKLSVPVPKATLATTAYAPKLTFTVPVSKASLALTGLGPSLKFNIPVGVASLTFAKYAPSLKLSVPIPKTTLVTTTHAPALALKVPVPKASLSTTAYAPSLALSVPVPKAVISITGHGPALQLHVPVGLATLGISEYAPMVALGTVLQPGFAHLSITGAAPSLKLKIPVGLATLAVAGHAPIVALGTVVQPGYAHLSLTGYGPVLQSVVRVPKAALAITGAAPSLKLKVPVGAAALAIAGEAPVVEISARLTVSPGYAHLTLTGYGPALQTTVRVPKTALSITGATPSLKITLPVGKASLSIAGFAPTISAGTATYLLTGAGALQMAGYPPFLTVTVPPFCWRGTESTSVWRGSNQVAGARGEWDISEWRGEDTPCQ